MNLNKPVFSKHEGEREQFQRLKIAVADRLRNSTCKDIEGKIKFALLPLLYIACWFAAVSFRSQPGIYLMFFGLMGIFMALIFVNLVHEACHQKLFHSKRMNRLTVYFLDLMGANSFIWQARHLRMHHNYPNTVGWDCDIEQGGPLKIFPTANTTQLQKTQHYWIFILYPLFLLNWLLVRDFRDFYSKSRYIRKVCDIAPIEHVKLWGFKLFYIGYVVLVPAIWFKIGVFQAVGGMIFQMVFGSLIGMIILLTPHANTGNAFPVPDEFDKLPEGWLRHQFETTNDVNGNNFLTRHLMNHFNWHLAHHLFPNLSAAEAAIATPCIRDFARENGYPYKCYSLAEAFRLHYALIKKNAVRPNAILEEDM